MTDEQKQRCKEAKNKGNKDITDQEYKKKLNNEK